MRFVCDSCRAQYMISDDKVGAKGVKVRCKKCGYVILVRKPEPESSAFEEATRVGVVNPFAPENTATAGPGEVGAPAATDAATKPGGPPPSDALLGAVDEDEIGAVFDQVIKGGPNKTTEDSASPTAALDNGADGPDEFDSTRVVSADAMRKMAADAETHVRGDKPSSEEPAEPKVPTEGWYVAVREEQVGPLALDRVKDLWDRGEIGAESLCWRDGFPDWLPLSEVKDLTAVLAPRPSKPVIVAPAAVSAPTPAPSAPVESLFSSSPSSSFAPSPSGSFAAASVSGSFAAASAAPVHTTPPRGEPPAEQESPSDGWQPSAASALASLAMQEVEALSKPAKPAGPPVVEPALAAGLLDVPPPEIAPEPPTNGKRHSFPQMPAVEHEEPIPRTVSGGYSSASAPFPQPSYEYRPPAAPPPPAPAPASRMMPVVIGSGIGLGVIVIGLLAYIAFRPVPAPAPVATIAEATPAPRETRPVAPPTNPPPSVQPAAQPAPAVTPPAAQAQTAAPAQPPAAQQTAPSAAQQPATAQAQPPAPPPAAGTAATPPGKTDAVAKVEPHDSAATKSESAGSREKRGTHKTERGSSSSGSSAVAETTPPPPPQKKSSTDDEFDDLFGGSKKSSGTTTTTGGKEVASTKGSKGYIPPPPGGGDVPERLGNSDVLAGVKQHIGELQTCIGEQKRKNPGLSGTLVMRWTILPSGRTTGVQVRSEEFKSTYLAGCFTGQIKNWSFPKHRVQGDPIDFPFKF